MPKLSVFLERERAVHALTGERITIGRAPDNMIQISHPSVSGRHAQLVLVIKATNCKSSARRTGRG